MIARRQAARGWDDRLRSGEQVFIRYLVESDREAYIALRRESREHLARWEPRPEAGFDAFGEDFFRRELSQANTEQNQRLVVCRRDGGDIVGRIGLSMIIRGPLQSCFTGYWTGARFAGRGYMGEGIGLALRHAFNGLGLNRVEANIQPHNEPSRAVVRRNGFRLEGFSPRYLKINGRWADHERWAIDAKAWREFRRQAPPPEVQRT